MWLCPKLIFLNTPHKDWCPFSVNLLFQRKFPPKFSIILVLSPGAFWFGCFILYNNCKMVSWQAKPGWCLCQCAQRMDRDWWGTSAPSSSAMQTRLPELEFQHRFSSVSSTSCADNGSVSKGYSLTVWCTGNQLHILGWILGWCKWVPGELSWCTPAEHSPVRGMPAGSWGNRSAQVNDIHLHILGVCKPLRGCLRNGICQKQTSGNKGLIRSKVPQNTVKFLRQEYREN